MKADVLVCRCRNSRRRETLSFGARIEERESSWHVTWTFPIDEARAGRERYGESITVRSGLEIDRPYRGCPHCEADDLVQCGGCRRFSCWRRGDADWECQWCGQTGAPTGTISSFEPSQDV